MATLPRYFTLKGDEGFLSVDALGDTPILSFSTKTPTRKSVHEAIYISDGAGHKLLSILAANGLFWKYKGDEEWISVAKEEAPTADDKDCIFKISEAGQNNMISFQVQGIDLNFAGTAKVLQFSNAEDIALNFPAFVMFKGNNGKYLSLVTDKNLLQFTSPSPNLDACFKVIKLDDGSLAFQSMRNSRYWRADSDQLMADADISTALTDKHCQFDAYKLSRSTVAIKSAANNGHYLTSNPKVFSSSVSNTQDPSTHLQVTDAAQKKHIFNVKYFLDLADVYDIEPIVMGKGSVVNTDSQKTDLTIQVDTDSVARSSMWKTSQNVGIEATVTVTAGIPEVSSAGGSIAVKPEKTRETELSKATSKQVGFNATYLVKDVAPGVEASVKVECTRAKCIVPFSYSLKTLRPDGVEMPVKDLVDGVFEGVSVFNIRGVIESTKVVDDHVSSKDDSNANNNAVVDDHVSSKDNSNVNKNAVVDDYVSSKDDTNVNNNAVVDDYVSSEDDSNVNNNAVVDDHVSSEGDDSNNKASPGVFGGVVKGTGNILSGVADVGKSPLKLFGK